jgi:vitamin B12 transporter
MLYLDILLRRHTCHIALCALIFLNAAFFAGPARAEVDEVSGSFGFAATEPFSTSRFPRPISKIAENVTVIGADDIARLNAHTLADVLQTVPGIQLDQMQTPGSAVFFSVLGARSRHVLVQIDGVPQNFLGADNLAEIGNIPVQMIERVEVVKGAASAAWGSALGGVINVITKSPARDRKIGGLASASAGERGTGDLRAELSGTVERFGYYLTGGTLRSDGLVPGNPTELNHGFGKFTLDLPNQGKLTLGIDFSNSDLGLEHTVVYDHHDTGSFGFLNGYLALSYPIADSVTLELNARGGRREVASKYVGISSPTLLQDSTEREMHQGGAATLNWGDAETNLSAGLEFEQDDTRQREPVRRAPQSNFDRSLERWSGHLNGTYSVGRLSILPGVRLDHTNLFENALSYTLGATYRLTDSTVLRAYAARGYSMPLINNFELMNGQRLLQNIWTVQTGIESGALPYLWLKGTLFYNNIWKIQDFDFATATIVRREQISQGIDLELRTSALYGFALSGGYTYIDAWDRQSKAELDGPWQEIKLGLNYDNSAIGLHGALTGNLASWHQPESPPKDSAVILDLHLNQRLFPQDEMSPELFFSARNIFNGDQYLIDFRANTPRWFEGGVRYRF